MASNLIRVVGIDNEVQKKLSNQKIDSLKKIRTQTRTAAGREELSEKTGFTLQEINSWAAQAELLRVPGMKGEEAVELMNAGILSVDQLKKADKEELLNEIQRLNEYRNVKTLLTEQKLSEYQAATVPEEPVFEMEGLSFTTKNDNDSQNGNQILGMYNDLSDVISDLGRGIAEAQYELDQHSIRVQNKIFENEKLTRYGLNATWYVMPEVEFTLKMDYSMSKETREDVSYDKADKELLPKRRFLIMPSNATTQNIFKSESTQQSVLKLRFVPVPPSEKYIVRRLIPDCVGKNILETKEQLASNDVDSYRFVDSKGNVVLEPDEKKVVEKQFVYVDGKKVNKGAGDLLPIGGVVEIILK